MKHADRRTDRLRYGPSTTPLAAGGEELLTALVLKAKRLVMGGRGSHQRQWFARIAEWHGAWLAIMPTVLTPVRLFGRLLQWLGTLLVVVRTRTIDLAARMVKRSVARLALWCRRGVARLLGKRFYR